jgi:hypothetical protein
MTIKFYGKTNPQYSWLSNFHVAIFTLQGHQWASTEHFYQAMKSEDPEVQRQIRSTATPGQAKRMGSKCERRDDWEDVVGSSALHAIFRDDRGIVVELVKDHFMYTALIAKFTQRPELRTALLNTGTEELHEVAPKDFYWGLGIDGTGQNKLGRMLQLVRAKLPQTR